MRQPTKTEYERIQDEYDNFRVMRARYRKALHLHDCRIVKSKDDDDVHDKPTDSYPFGYLPICDCCLKIYRDEVFA